MGTTATGAVFITYSARCYSALSMNTAGGVARALIKLLLGRGTYRSFGQNGEDAIIHSLIRGIPKGTYVDVGAYHPILYSNTYGLYREGWRGLTIDPNPSMGKLHRILRPRDTFVLGGIAAQEEVRDYYRFSDGAYNTLDAEYAERIKRQNYPTFLGKETAHLFPLRTILKKHNIQKVDFLDIDIEGLDVSALESLDWTYPPSVIAIESQTFLPDALFSDAACAFLYRRGYTLAGFIKYTLVFVHQGPGAIPSH